MANAAPVRSRIASRRAQSSAVANTSRVSECASVYSSCASCASRLIGDTTYPPYIAPRNTVAALAPFGSKPCGEPRALRTQRRVIDLAARLGSDQERRARLRRRVRIDDGTERRG